ncbi:hypothetical protein F3157_21475 [Virgibacillus dakarensis]|uniref:Uncharacterized protein n=1 Tax=Lentibacillus populi TaxID=1827502 RepID=A0A9W5X6Y0_9BACI|nr:MULTISPECIES: DUF6179 domain-containing protein [Bacillaceae]MBT2217757.1 hypothetical protein [Virgibacillus dakarensis]MTW88166.1 hypothetical protein [Virgibacillus dakarensis]GGB54942.1 hypothetical protein GCM10011409_35690 [Lentibacillus populi]
MESEKRYNDHSLVTQGKVNQTRLLQNQYTLSILNEGLRIGLLNNEDIYGTQRQLMSILEKLIRRYTQGESSSVTSETAVSILSSVLYAVDAYLLHFNDPEKAMDVLKNGNIKNGYDQGIDLICHCFEETKQLYKEINNNKLDVAVEAYNLTIDESIPVFLKKYGIIFDAHNTMASIDYPLAIDDMSIQGVYYFRQYLTHLKMENQFCLLFNKDDIQSVLVNYGRICGFDYRIELFNIFELVLNNAVFSILSGGHASQIKISINQYKQLVGLFEKLDDSQIQYIILKAVNRLRHHFNIKDPQMTDYLKRCGMNLVNRVKSVVKHNRLDTVVIVEKELRSKPIVTTFKASDRMSDSRFRLLVEKIMNCEKTVDKVNMIRTNFHSLHDYIDMLNTNCLLDDEYEELFKTFGDVDLAILTKIVFYEELRNGSTDLSSLYDKEEQHESEWQPHFIEFIKSININRKGAIEKYVNDIDYEEISFY